MEKQAYDLEATVFVDEGRPIAKEVRYYADGIKWSSARFDRAFTETIPFITDIENIKLGTGELIGRQTALHSLEVAKLARNIAEAWTGVPAIADLATTGGLAHDIGKLQVGSKRGKLLDMSYTYDPKSDDYVIMSEHPFYGYEILSEYTRQINQSQITDKLNLLPEQVVALLHHHSKRQTESNCGSKLDDKEALLVDVIQFVEQGLKPENVRKAILAVTIADVYHAISSRQYVPEEHLLIPRDKSHVLDWMTGNIDATRIGLSVNDALAAAKALVEVIQNQTGQSIISHSERNPNHELVGFRKPRKKLGEKILTLMS